VLTSQVFVSHTSDMEAFPVGRSFVQAVLDGVGRAGMAAVDMRYFAARDGMPIDYCRQRVRECEVYVAVIGFRYGSLVPGTELSYTEAEFQEAGAAGIPRLVFLLDEGTPMPEGAADADPGAVRQFRQRLSWAGLIIARFAAPADLELAVFHALIEVAGTRSSTVPGPGIRHSLPPDTAAFTGREAELEQITPAVTAFARGAAVAIRVIGGMPGAGKTALAVHAAHLLRERFPDRQLFIDLHAHTPGREPVAPHDALAGLLAATGADPRFVPGDLDGRAGMWRDRMARQRALLVLDDAASSAQVAPLLPGGGNCLVLVTSRRHLGDLPGAVVPVSLDVLPAERAEEMFTRLAPRAAADPDTVAEVARLAGCLPLAISLLARLSARHPSWTLADLAAETRDSLLTLKSEHSTIAAAFEVSYRHLNPAQQRLFSLLGLHPGTTTDRYAAAALASISPAEAGALLDALHGEGLLTETGHRRYGMHDLLRRYARHQAAVDPDQEQALGRLLDYYQHTAARANARIARQTRSSHPPPAAAPDSAPALQDAVHALAWTRAERDTLLACLDHATRTGQHARVIALTAAIAELVQRDGLWTEAITLHATAVQSARQLGDRLGEADALHNLGTVRQLSGDSLGAGDALEQALALSRDLGDRLGEADALHNLGTVRRLTGDYPGAADALEQALALSRDLGDRLGEANALHNLGIVRRLTADYPGAADNLERALALYHDLGNRLGRADALHDLGAVRRLTGDYPGAADALERALALYRDIGDRRGQANALNNLGEVRRATGDYQGAARDLEQALAIYRDIGSRDGQADVLNQIGTLHRVIGQLGEAEAYHRQALELGRAIGSAPQEAHALAGLGRCAAVVGQVTQAQALLRRAYEIFQRIGAADAPSVLTELDALNP
jgi:tetratricopeptide (TPR) repeat protein